MLACGFRTRCGWAWAGEGEGKARDERWPAERALKRLSFEIGGKVRARIHKEDSPIVGQIDYTLSTDGALQLCGVTSWL